ncbi:hypothetical protein EJB05_13755 [Eragrostis curvula]|uniref:Peroxidase n=1 Tax=Eragrostis curvula TaxID=38414 RepID=A0A5J9VXE5_9POAL|nr:hypothetical protein EJB05_13755 [Eragrostis curvula]
MGAGSVRLAATLLVLVVTAAGSATVCEAQLRRNYYAGVCPNVEAIVRGAVAKKVQQTLTTIGATVRLFFHDCFFQGCDASVIVASTANNTAEKDHPNNLSLAGDGFDTVIKAKAAVDAVPQCRNKVSCADILTMATRDVIALVRNLQLTLALSVGQKHKFQNVTTTLLVQAGGPSYAVELGRLDGLSSTASSVNGKLPAPFLNLDQLTAIFATNGLSQADMIALSADPNPCRTFAGRISGPSPDPTMNPSYAAQLRTQCPANVDPRIALSMDPVTPVTFDNQYFKNLQNGKGLLASDQVLYSDPRSRPIVDAWARSNVAFNRAFVTAMAKLGRVGVKTGAQGTFAATVQC